MTEYWIEVSCFLARQPGTMAVLGDCGLTVVRKGPVTFRPLSSEPDTEFWLISDPGADASLQDKTVELVFERFATTPDTGDAPTMDVITYSHRIKSRKAV